MARTSASSSKVYVDEFDFSGRSNSVTLTVDNTLPEVTCFGDAGAEFVEGLLNAKINIGGFFDAADDGYDEQMWACIGDGAEHYIGYCPGNSGTYGNVCYEVQGKADSQDRPVEVAGAILLNCNWQGSGGIVRGTILCNTSVTGTGAVTNSNQNTGTTTSGQVFVATVRVLSVTGAGTVQVDIEQSSDDGSGDAYAQLLQSSALGAIGVERLTTTAATEAYKRVNITTLGFDAATVMVTVGIEQGT